MMLVIKYIFPPLYKKINKYLRRMEYLEDSVNNLEQIAMWLLQKSENYKSNADIVRPKTIKSDINQYEFRLHSQNGEDGILLYLFSKIGIVNRKCVEIGLNAKTDNSTNLIRNLGWNGFLVEGSPRIVKNVKQYYENNCEVVVPPTVVHTWITRDNINQLLSKYGVTGEIDLLSLDIDGNDYWIWEAINTVSARVVVIEYNPVLGYQKAITIPYRDDFSRPSPPIQYYYGASLRALAKLGQQKGYVLAGCDSAGTNCFFVRNDCARGKIKDTSPEEAYYPYGVQHPRGQKSMNQEFENIKSLPFVYVE